MKILLLLLFISFNSFAQFTKYSNYYNSKSNIDANINVTKSITTIDYGALALANAKREEIRIKRESFKSKKDSLEAIEIANNPLSAFDYGIPTYCGWQKEYWSITEYNLFRKKFDLKKNGEGTTTYKIPKKIYSKINCRKIINISDTGIENKITMWGSIPKKAWHYHKSAKLFLDSSFFKLDTIWNNKGFEVNLINENDFNIEEILSFKTLSIGQLSYWLNQDKLTQPSEYVHSKYIKRATVFGERGLCGTLIIEDKFSKYISDYYMAKRGDKILVVNSIYEADKEISFEEIEGRRAYLKPLIDRMIATSIIID